MTTDHLIITEPRRKSALVTAIILSNVITMLNAGSVNIAMPVLMESFQANLNQVQWVMLAYILTLACAMPLVTALSERYSYRKVFLNCLIIIGILSMACAFAGNLWVLIGFRILKGFFSGLIMSATMALIYRYLPKGERAGRYATVLIIQSIAFAIGPSFAGLIMQWTSWRVIFVMPALMVIPAYLEARKALPRESVTAGVRLEIGGVLLVSLATGMLLLAFTFLESWGISDWRFWAMIIGAIALVAYFIVHNRRNPHPALDFSLFKLSSFALAVLLSMILSTVIGITASVLAVYVQSVRGYAPFFSGAVQFAPSIIMAGANALAKRLYGRTSTTLLVVCGFSVAALGNALMNTVGMERSLIILSAILTIRYVGIAFVRLPISDVGMSAVPQDKVSHASAFINWVNQLSQAISTNILTVIFTFQANLLFHQAGGLGEALPGKEGYAEAALSAFHLVFSIMAGLMLLGGIVSLFMVPAAKRDKARRKAAADNS